MTSKFTRFYLLPSHVFVLWVFTQPSSLGTHWDVKISSLQETKPTLYFDLPGDSVETLKALGQEGDSGCGIEGLKHTEG